jgi:hypothetical protein
MSSGGLAESQDVALRPATWRLGKRRCLAGDGEDQSFIAEDLDRSQNRVTAYVVLLLELLRGRQGAVSKSALRSAGHRPVQG